MTQDDIPAGPNTPIPANIVTPDGVETRIGELEFSDGFPTTALEYNDDGSVDILFGPEPPAGRQNNWIQTVPGKGWFALLRLYGPLDPWFEQTWKPGDIERID